MSLNPNGVPVKRYSWNMSRPNDDDYTLELWGTVLALQEVQAREYNPNGKTPGKPRFWPNGNPVWNIRMALAKPDGELVTVTFSKASKKQYLGEKPSLHIQLYNLAGNKMESLIGKSIHLWTWAANPETGAPWGVGNPRLFGVEEITDMTYSLNEPLPDEFKVDKVYCDDAVAGGQPAAQQQAQPAPMPQYQQPYYGQPMGMPQYQQRPQAAQMPQYQPMPQPQYQQMPQQQYQQMPQGIDPAVAAAMQAVGATNIQAYDDLPF